MSFSTTFNHVMEDLGVTNKRAAEILGVHQTTIARWRKEPDAKPDDASHIAQFAQHYRLSITEENALLEAAGLEKIIADEPAAIYSRKSLESDHELDAPSVSITPAPAHYNPFVVGQPVTKKHFFGREKILQNLFSLWNAYPYMPIQNAAIWGEKRIGKTSLLKHIKALVTADETQLRPEQAKQRAKWLPNASQYNFIYVDFQNKRLQTQTGLLAYLLKEMDLDEGVFLAKSANPLSDFNDIVGEYLRQPTIIMLDEIGTALRESSTEFSHDFWESLRSLATTEFDPSRLGFLLSSPEPPKELEKLAGMDDGNIFSVFFNIFGYMVKLDAFSEPEARTLIASSTPPFAEEAISAILEKSLKPYDLQIACRAQYELEVNLS